MGKKIKPTKPNYGISKCLMGHSVGRCDYTAFPEKRRRNLGVKEYILFGTWLYLIRHPYT
jgi:hypothetical protein